MKKRFEIIFLILAMVVSITAIGCKKQGDKKVDASKTKNKKQIEVKQTVEAFGKIKARDYKDINLDFPAQIVEVPVKDGQNVRLGETLVCLNINDFQAMINSKENELNAAKFELLKNEKTLRDAQITYERAKRQLVKKEELLREGIIPQKEVDDYRDVVLEKEKLVTDIKLSLSQKSDLNGLAVQSEKIAVLEYDLKRMRNKLNQSFLKGNIIVSDYQNAVVDKVNCAAGNSVGTGEKQEKLLSIVNLNSLYISADVPEEFVKDVKVGSKVTILPVADNKRKYHGQVVRISDVAVETNGETNIPVEISIDNNDGFLKPNYNVDVEIEKLK